MSANLVQLDFTAILLTLVNFSILVFIIKCVAIAVIFTIRGIAKRTACASTACTSTVCTNTYSNREGGKT